MHKSREVEIRIDLSKSRFRARLFMPETNYFFFTLACPSCAAIVRRAELSPTKQLQAYGSNRTMRDWEVMIGGTRLGLIQVVRTWDLSPLGHRRSAKVRTASLSSHSFPTGTTDAPPANTFFCCLYATIVHQHSTVPLWPSSHRHPLYNYLASVRTQTLAMRLEGHGRTQYPLFQNCLGPIRPHVGTTWLPEPSAVWALVIGGWSLVLVTSVSGSFVSG